MSMSTRSSRSRQFSFGRCLCATFLTVTAGVALAMLTSILTGGDARADSPQPTSLQRLTDPRVVVVKHQRLLHLFDGGQLVRTYPVGLGRRPIGQKIHRNDNRTPVGTFYICSRNRHSRFHRFLGISYPNEDAAKRGVEQGWISAGQAHALRSALEGRRRPTWDTALGGGIGLHGGGADSDWTAGCIALANDGIEELYAVVDIGTPVEILP